MQYPTTGKQGEPREKKRYDELTKLKKGSQFSPGLESYLSVD